MMSNELGSKSSDKGTNMTFATADLDGLKKVSESVAKAIIGNCNSSIILKVDSK